MSAWFRNLHIYRITKDVPAFMPAPGVMGSGVDNMIDALNHALHTKPSREPASQEISTYGFCEPYPQRQMTLADREEPELLDEIEPDVPQYVRSVHNGRYLLICASGVSKAMPSNAIKRAVKKKVDQIEAEQMRKVYKKERDQLKDEVIQAMVVHAPLTEKRTFAAIDTQDGLIYVDTSSAARAEDLLSTLRECLGSLPIRPLTTKLRPATTFTEWVKKTKCYGDFYLMDAAVMEDQADGGGKVAMVHQDLTSDEAQLHVESGKLVTRIALAYEDKLGFLLNEKMVFTKLTFNDLLKSQADEDGGEDFHGQLDASFFLMMETFSRMLPELLEGLSGEDVPQGI